MPDTCLVSESDQLIAENAAGMAADTVYMRLSGVSLQLPTFLQHDRGGKTWLKTLLTAATDRPERRLSTILDNINLNFEDGDRVALIGRNGAGKTTLLNVLTGCYQPTMGRVDVVGRRQALLNVSLGFNYEATVRENVMLRGTAMGMHMAELQDLVEPILDFADLREVTNHRLGTLSAGQRMRLGFAISTSVQPDIMLLDEWIGAGDAEFMAKARQRMQDRVGGSRVLVLASHSADLLKRVCNRGVVLDGGTIHFEGAISDALKFYDDSLRATPLTVKSTTSAPVEFRRRNSSYGSHYGLIFTSPVHYLFDNRTVHEALGRSDYVCLLETDASLSEILGEMVGSLRERGFEWAACEGAGLPNVFHYRRQDGATAAVTLTPYGAKDNRQSPKATGRLHIRLANWPL